MNYFKQLIRFPGLTIHPKALTGNSSIDDYLKDLDRRLLGSRTIRLSKVMDIKSHIVDRIDRLIETGETENESAVKAVREMDHPKTLAKEFNRAQFEIFVKTAIYFGVFMTAFDFFFFDGNAVGGKNGFSLNDILFHIVFMGSWMGLFMVYYFPLYQTEILI